MAQFIALHPEGMKERIFSGIIRREIPRSQRCVNRPKLTELLKWEETKNRNRRNKLLNDAVIRCVYDQNEISDHLGMHYSTMSRLLKMEEKISKIKT